jgi:2-polyprenyl-3-methyl-5-hydroxy-6-metoxy-1,4-benzoquinol methylase
MRTPSTGDDRGPVEHERKPGTVPGNHLHLLAGQGEGSAVGLKRRWAGFKHVQTEPSSFSAADAELQPGLEVLGSATNYLSWIGELCDPFLGREVLEVGAGRGDLTEGFAQGRVVTATDLSPAFLEALQARFAGNPNVRVGTLDLEEFVPGDRYDAVVMINVLEHIEHDIAALEALRGALRPGGHLVIWVPAFQALYSDMDRRIGHYRRYTRASLEARLVAAGYTIAESRYVNSLGMVAWFVFCRLLGQESSQGWVVQTWDRLAVPTLRLVERRFRAPFGLSVFCAARRADED